MVTVINNSQTVTSLEIASKPFNNQIPHIFK